jgi:hypothetical protein
MGVNKNNLAVLSVFAVDQGCKRDDDAVVTRRRIIIKIEKRFSRAMGNIILQGLKTIRGGGFAPSATAILAGIKGMVRFGMFHQLAPFNSQNETIVGFKKVLNTEAINPVILWFLQDHDIHDFLPSL